MNLTKQNKNKSVYKILYTPRPSDSENRAMIALRQYRLFYLQPASRDSMNH